MRAILSAMVVLACAGASAHGAEIEVHGLQRRLWGGSSVSPVVRADAVETEGPFRLVWALTYGPYVVEGEVRGLTAPVEQKIALEMPAVRVRTALAFEVRLFAGGEQVAEGRREVDLFPRGRLQALAAAIEEREIGLVAIGVGAREWAERLPLECEELASELSVGRFDGDLIVMVATERPAPMSGLVDSLLRRVEDGLSVVCLGEVGAMLPPTEPGTGGPGSVSKGRLLAPNHAAVGGLHAGDLSEWGIDGVVASRRFGWPKRGNGLTILDGGPATTPYSLLIEVRRGRGRILCCALDVVEKLREEPVAEIVFANLISRGLAEAPALARCMACVADSSPLAAALAELGVQFTEGRPGPEDVLLADESLTDGEHGDLLAGVLRRGGTIVLFGLDEQGADRLSRALTDRWRADVSGRPPEFHLAPVGPEALQGFELEGAHELLAGVRPEDVRALAADADEVVLQATRAAADQEHFADLAGGGVLAKFERDEVRIVFWQVPVTEKLSGPQRRVLAALLTNLNVPLSADDQP